MRQDVFASTQEAKACRPEFKASLASKYQDTRATQEPC